MATGCLGNKTSRANRHRPLFTKMLARPSATPKCRAQSAFDWSSISQSSTRYGEEGLAGDTVVRPGAGRAKSPPKTSGRRADRETPSHESRGSILLVARLELAGPPATLADYLRFVKFQQGY